MAWKRFAKIHNGEVTAIVESTKESIDGMIDVTGSTVYVGSLTVDEGQTFDVPNADESSVLKALVLITKAAIQEGIIPLSIVPQEAKDIWQRVKENRQ